MYHDVVTENDLTVTELERTYREAERVTQFASLKGKEIQIAKAVLTSVAGYLRNAFRLERCVPGSAPKRLSYG